MVWLSRRLILAAIFAIAPALYAQEPGTAAADEAHYDFFAGIVSDLPAGRVTVSRTALGKSENRTFVIAPETKIEGKLRPRARVTVRFRSSEEGDVAVHIIVRSSSLPAPPKKTLRSSRVALVPILP